MIHAGPHMTWIEGYLRRSGGKESNRQENCIKNISCE